MFNEFHVNLGNVPALVDIFDSLSGVQCSRPVKMTRTQHKVLDEFAELGNRDGAIRRYRLAKRFDSLDFVHCLGSEV